MLLCTFVATVPATPLLESVPRQDFVFYKGSMQYNIAANGDFSKRLLILMDKSEEINTRSMGFLQEWKNEPLWSI